MFQSSITVMHSAVNRGDVGSNPTSGAIIEIIRFFRKENKVSDGEQIAAIEGDIHVGLRDFGAPVMWFGVELLTGGALIVLNWDRAKEAIEEAGVYDISKLRKKPCVVRCEGGVGGTVKFVRFKV